MRVDERLQPFLQDMRIDLRRRNVSMPEQLLHRSEIGAAIEQMAGEGMPQHVRRDAVRTDARLIGNLFQVLREALSGHMAES